MTKEEKKELLDVIEHDYLEYAGAARAGYFEDKWVVYLVDLIKRDIKE